MEHLIELKDVYKIYQMGEETVHALDGVSLTIDQGEFVAIVGSSGSGKSTAMNLITHDNSIAVKADRIVRLQDGKIIYDGDAHDPRAVVRPEEMEQDEPAAGGFSDASPAEQEAGA